MRGAEAALQLPKAKTAFLLVERSLCENNVPYMNFLKHIAACALASTVLLAGQANAKEASETKVDAEAQSEFNSSTRPANRFGEAWWKERWEADNSEADTAAAKDAKIVFLGDSITQGWGTTGKAAWEKHFAPLGALNWGYSGDRTEHLIWRLQNGDIQRVSPEVAVILIGTNNTGHDQRPATETFEGMKKVVEEVTTQWPDAKVVLLSIFPRGATPEDSLRKLNAEINEKAKELADGKQVHFLDLNGKFLDEDGNLSKEVFPDLLHLSPAAYDTWAEALLPKLKELGVE